jgi:hypothetical protein
MFTPQIRPVLFAMSTLLAAFALWSVERAASRSHIDPVPVNAAPVLMELFTSEGCSSCPPADDLLRGIVTAGSYDGVPVIALSEHVDYWNRLGWADPFSSSAFTRRQQQYSDRLSSNVYTPQMVVDGQIEFVGSDRGAARHAVRRAAGRAKFPLTLAASVVESTRVNVVVTPASDTPHRDELDVIAAIAEDGVVSNVLRGENEGKTLAHAAVTRRLQKIGTWHADRKGAPITGTLDLDPAWHRDRLRVVAFVQARDGGRVAGATSVPLPLHVETR